MGELKIGNYEIQNQVVYDTLVKSGTTTEAMLKHLDKNGDFKITEDELTSVELSNDDESSETSGLSEADQKRKDQAIDTAKKSYQKSLENIYKQVQNQEDQKRKYIRQMGSATSAESLAEYSVQIANIRTTIADLKNQIPTLTAEFEEKLAKIEDTFSAKDSEGDYDITSMTSSDTGLTNTSDTTSNVDVSKLDQNFTEKLSSRQSSEINMFKEHWAKNKGRYESVAAKTGVPAQLIASIHWREAGGDFNARLHDGGSLSGFSSWEDAAIDALSGDYGKIDKNDIQTWYNFAEHYNGMGYRNKGVASPYVWAGTTNYSKGKYVADGVYDGNYIDNQLGVAVMLKAIL